MANCIKKNLEYFALDTNFFQDIKIRKLIRHEGGKSLSVYIAFLCVIYNEGYYIKYDSVLPFVVSEMTGFEESNVTKILAYCLEIGLFSQKMFDNDKILTSRGIQKRYNEVCAKAKRKYHVSEYNIIDIYEEDIACDEPEPKAQPVKKSEPKTGNELEEIRDYFNSCMASANIPQITKITGQRAGYVNGRLREYGKESIKKVIRKASRSSFLNGGGNKGFVADFSWIMRPNNFPKVLEGNYDNKALAAKTADSQTAEQEERRTRRKKNEQMHNENLTYACRPDQLARLKSLSENGHKKANDILMGKLKLTQQEIDSYLSTVN